MAVLLKPLSNQVVVITGATSGIGLATAERMAAAGARLVLNARGAETLDRVAARLGGPDRVATVAGDIGDEATAPALVDAARAKFGGLDTWVNNAAAALYARVTQIAHAEHRKVFETGYFGTVQGSLAAVGALRGRGGAIINIGSVLSERAVPVQGSYSAMKHAVRGFTDALRMELEMEDAGISVTLIKPNGMNTPYPEHARNKMGKPARIPPVVYDPRLVAKAIAHAAEHPVRELTVGGAGIAVAKLPNLLPRAADFGMEAIMGEQGQTIDQAPPPGVNDNLFESRANGRIDSDQDIMVRHESRYLDAQMNPGKAALGGIAAVGIGALLAALVSRRDRLG